MTCPICRQDHEPALTPLEAEVERLRAERDEWKKTAEDEARARSQKSDRAENAEAEVERLRAETADIWNKWSDAEEKREHAEERLAKVVEALTGGNPHGYECCHGVPLDEHCDEPDCSLALVRSLYVAAAQPEEKP